MGFFSRRRERIEALERDLIESRRAAEKLAEALSKMRDERAESKSRDTAALIEGLFGAGITSIGNLMTQMQAMTESSAQAQMSLLEKLQEQVFAQEKHRQEIAARRKDLAAARRAQGRDAHGRILKAQSNGHSDPQLPMALTDPREWCPVCQTGQGDGAAINRCIREGHRMVIAQLDRARALN